MEYWIPIALLVIIAVLIVVVLRARFSPAVKTHPKPLSAPLPEGAPRPGEVWWAEVPFEDTNDSKHRPCLVLGLYREGFHVLKITSQQKSARHGFLQIPTTSWDPKAEKNSYLDVKTRLVIVGSDFDRKAGNVDDKTWRLIKRLHKI